MTSRTNAIFITGTDTEVGKTEVAAGLAGALHRRWNGKAADIPASRETLSAGGRAVDAFGQEKGSRKPELGPVPIRLWKPVQSGAVPGSAETDSARLIAGSGLPLREEDVASFTFTEPLTPWLAARAAGTEVDFAALAEEGRRRLGEPGFWLMEGAGGLIVPLTGERLVVDLAAELGLPLLIVARPGLGTVNHTLLTAAYARQAGLEVLGVVMNGCEDCDAPHVIDNAMMIERFGGIPVLGRLPWLSPSAGETAVESRRARWIEAVETNVRLEAFDELRHEM